MENDRSRHHPFPNSGKDPAVNASFAISLSLNVTFVVIEAAFGFFSHSMALVADAAHNLSDVMGLALAWLAAGLARRKPTGTRTYGLRKSTVLAALANSILLLVAVGMISREAIGRFHSPLPVKSPVMIAVAALAVAINTVSALLFLRGRKRDVNIRAAFLHLAADAAVSLGVVAAGLAIMFSGKLWIDPLASLAVSAVIVAGTWSLLKEALNLALDAVPRHIDPEDVRAYLVSLPGIRDVHDLHIWAMSTTETALTAHLLKDGTAMKASFLSEAGEELKRRFHIDHATLQIEPPGGVDPCRQSCEDTP